VAAPVTFARMHVVPRLAGFLDVNPGVHLELVLDDRSIDLLGENIDVAYRAGGLSDSAMTARKITQSQRFLAASPAYLARRGTPRRPSDLLQHDAIVFRQAADGDEWRFHQGSAETSVRPNVRLTVTAAEGVREAVIAGLGMTIGSDWMFAPELASGEVLRIMPDWALPPIDLWAVYPAGRLPSAKARAFTTWMEAMLKAAGPNQRAPKPPDASD
jgi:DNA-binding transcriptional LysR family regulator